MAENEKPRAMGSGRARRMAAGRVSLKSITPGTFKRVLSYMLGNHKFAFAIVVVCIILTALATLVATLFMRSLIDDYIIPMVQSGSTNFESLAHALYRLALIAIAGVIAAYTYNRIMIYISEGTMLRLRLELFEHMETLPIGYFDTHSHGDIMSVYTNDVDTLRQMISQSIPQIVNATVSVTATFISMVVLSIPLTVLTILMVFVMTLVAGKLGSKVARYFAAQQSDLGAVNGHIEEMVEGQKVVKVFCHEQINIDQFTELNDRLRDSANNANKYANVMMPVNNNLGNISYVLCAIVGAVFALNGYFGLTLGMLVTFLSLNRGFSQPIVQVTQQVNSIAMALAGAERVFALLDSEPETDEGKVRLVNVRDEGDGTLVETEERTEQWAWKLPQDAAGEGNPELVKLAGDVRFDNVDFSYDGEKVILHDIKMFATPGQKIAFVGSTGAGKTTITNLINRFYDIHKGSITYDGIDVKDISKSDLRRSLGIVLQDTHLFTDTVLENIRYGRLEATDEECMEAARLANADGFIRRLPEGYNTMLTGDGTNLSQGQRQLIAIARAAVADPPALILDEATSSIDTRTEALVQEGMDSLMKGRTTFVIAHRLSTVRDANCIMVLENGRIIERGTHEELLEQQGRYYQLYTGNAIGE